MHGSIMVLYSEHCTYMVILYNVHYILQNSFMWTLEINIMNCGENSKLQKIQ